MDIIFILIFLIAVIVFDQEILKRLNPIVAKKIFGRWSVLWGGAVLIPVGIILFEKYRGEGHARSYGGILLLASMFGIYLARRSRFEQRKSSLKRGRTNSRYVNTSLMADCLGVILLWIFFLLNFTVIFHQMTLLVPALENDLVDVLSTAVFSLSLVLILIVRACRKNGREGFLKMVALKVQGLSRLRLFVTPFLIGMSMAVVSSFLIMNRPVNPKTPLNEIIQGASSSYLIMIFMAIAILIAPLVEEIVFRGYLYYVLERYWGRLFAFYFVALSFSLLHVGQYWGDWEAILIVTLLGFILTRLRVWSGTTVAGVVTHYTYNGLVTLIPIVVLLTSNPDYLKYQSMYPDLSSPQKEVLLKESIRKQPKFVEAYNDLADLYAKDGRNLDEALRTIQQALDVFPNNAVYLQTKAEILSKLGRLDQAIGIEEDLLRQNPRDQDIQKQLKEFRKTQKAAGR